MTIVFKSGKSLKVDSEVVKKIRDAQAPANAKEWLMWLNDENGKVVGMINILDISHIKS